MLGPSGESGSNHYHSALSDIHRELRHPIRQRQLFALSQASPRELVRSKLSVNEIQHRALTYLPEEMLAKVPENSSPYSLFQGFEASLPDDDRRRRKHGRQGSRGRKLLEGKERDAKPGEPPALSNLRNEKHGLDHRLEMLGVRKNMCSTEIREIDSKILNLNSMREIVLDRLADLEQEEQTLQREMYDVDTKLEDLEEELEDEAAMAGQKTPTQQTEEERKPGSEPDSPSMEASFMSESMYEKLPTPKKNRPKPGRRKTTFILHEHLQSGSKLRELQAHNDVVSAMDFDAPFGTMVTAALDDTVRVWDLNAGRCIGLLEGHLSSVRCLQVEDNLVATGSMDASVRVWDLSQADYNPSTSNNISKKAPLSHSRSASPTKAFAIDDDEEDETPFIHESSNHHRTASSTKDCELLTLSAHVAEVTALHFHNNTLISGSADKTLRQWDLENGRCVQTLDVLWAAAQASSSINTSLSGGSSSAGMSAGQTKNMPSGRATDASADFVGALQCFDAALACGTADGMVRLWDLRSGQVHRSLVGHTGPVTSLQFDDVHLVTGSADRSIRVSHRMHKEGG